MQGLVGLPLQVKEFQAEGVELLSRDKGWGGHLVYPKDRAQRQKHYSQGLKSN